MNEIIRNYQISKVNTKNIRRVIHDINKIKYVESVTIDKEKDILRLEYKFNDKEKVVDKKISEIEEKILKVLAKYEKKVSLEQVVNKKVYRDVLYLNGLDCAHCATRIETIAKKTLNYEKILVDYTSFRFIIESSDEEQMKNITELVTEISHKVDDRIVVTRKTDKEKIVKQETKNFYTLRKISIILGILTFVIGMLFLIEFKLEDWSLIFNHDDALNQDPNGFLITHVVLMICTYILIGYPIIIRFFKNLYRRQFFDENSLMTIASIGAIVTTHYVEAILVMALFQIGETLQHYAVNKSRKSIEELLKLDVKIAKLKKNDEIIEIDVESILPDDIIVVNKGEMIPLDGILLDNHAILDTKNLTGEAIHRSVKKNEEIMAGSVNMGQMIEIKVIRPYSESMITKIIDMVENASTSKSKSENFITKFSKYYTPTLLFLAFVCSLTGFLMQFTLGSYTDGVWNLVVSWVYRAMVFLVISCPCALVISIPLSFFLGIGVSSKNGILIKGSNYLEALNNPENVVFDKTGTLTKGEFKITKVVSEETSSDDEVLRNLMYTEFYSNHPIGSSIVDDYGRENIYSEIISDFASIQGGAKAVINGKKVVVGNLRLMQSLKIEVPVVEANGLVIYVVKEKQYLGYVIIGDTIREEAKEAIDKLRKQGVEKFYILTGDSKGIGESVAKTLNIDTVYSELLPNEKVEKLQEIRDSAKKGKTIFVGDGINDAPAIATSDVGIAMGTTGSDATIAISDVVIMSDDLNKLPQVISLAKTTRLKVYENIVFSLAIKVIVMVLALVPSQPVPLWLAIFSDVGVSLLAIFNSMLIMFDYNFKVKKERKKANEKQE